MEVVEGGGLGGKAVFWAKEAKIWAVQPSVE